MGISRAAKLVLATALLIIGACADAPLETGVAEVETSDDAQASPAEETEATDGRAHDVVKLAEEYVGTPYRPGGTSRNGVDCSGLAFSVFRSVGVRLPRASDDQAHAGDFVGRYELKAGDLVFFGNGSQRVTHVGIYAGDGEFIHASTRARSVRFDRLDNKYFKNRYLTARRVL